MFKTEFFKMPSVKNPVKEFLDSLDKKMKVKVLKNIVSLLKTYINLDGKARQILTDTAFSLGNRSVSSY